MSLHSFERKSPPMFRRSLSPAARMGLVAVLAIVLMLVDGRWQVGNGVRSGLATVLRPFQWLSAQPVKAVDLMGSYVTTVESAQQTKEQATLQIAQLALKAQRAELLMRENAALRELLGLQQQLPMQARAAEVAYVSADPFVRKVTLNKGSAQGIAQGAPVIDGYGLLGQVVRVFPLSSEVLLVDNPQQAVPALNNRTGERSLVYGDSQNPRGNALEIRFLSNADDVQVGDVIVTSGVGGIYPAGLPLGTVAVVERRNNSAFLRVQLTPAAHMLSVDHVLVLDPVPQAPMPEAEQADAAKSGRSRARASGVPRASGAASTPDAASAAQTATAARTAAASTASTTSGAANSSAAAGGRRP